MMKNISKSNIVKRLLENNQITAEEAVVLLKEVKNANNSKMVPYGTICPCNPANGGDGICGCIAGNTLVNLDDYSHNYQGINYDNLNLTSCFCDGSCNKSGKCKNAIL